MSKETKTLHAAIVTMLAALFVLGAAGSATSSESETAPTDGLPGAGTIRELLSLVNLEGNLGVNEEVLDAMIGGSGASPAALVAQGRDLLDRFSSAGSASQALSAVGANPAVDVPVAPTLDQAILELYSKMGVAITPLTGPSVAQSTSGIDAATAGVVTELVSHVTAAIDAATSEERLDAAGALLAFVESLPGALSSSSASSAVCPQPPIFEDPESFVTIRGTCSDTYVTHHVLQVDLGGNDFYFNNAGGASTLNLRIDPNPDQLRDNFPVAVSVDLGFGSDTYSSTTQFSQGGAFGAIGVLFDQGGADGYTATGGFSQGMGGGGGIGILVDGGGSDTYDVASRGQGSGDGGYLLDLGLGGDSYTGGTGSQGARMVPFPAGLMSAILFDAGGDDSYTVNGIGQGVGNFLVDASGDDTYTATGSATPSILDGFAQGVGIVANSGLLVDGLGSDVYTSDIFISQGVALGTASGALLDFGGNDVYQAAKKAQAICETQGGPLALLFDAVGDDTYSTPSGQGSSRGPCSAFLVDGAGDDSYTAGAESQGTAVPTPLTLNPVLGALVDAGGDDVYTAGARSQAFGDGGAGLLIDADGEDSFTAGSFSQGSSLGGLGLLVDGLQGAVGARVGVTDAILVEVEVPGDDGKADHFTAGVSSQGSGAAGGVGVLVDNDDETTANGGPNRATYVAGNSSQGSGTDGSIGALVNREGSDQYSAGVFSQGSSVNGAIGTLIDLDGKDRYTVTNTAISRGYGDSTPENLALGLFLDTDDEDRYTEFLPGTHNDLCETKGDVGLTVDTDLPAVPPGCIGQVVGAATILAGAAEAFLQNLVNEVLALVTPPPAPPGPCTGAPGEYFCDDVEAGADGWTTIDGIGQWRVVNQAVTPVPGGENANSGQQYWYVGSRAYPGVAYHPAEGGILDPPTLTSPTIDLTAATFPHLTVAISGSSEAGFDFLRVGVVAGATTTQVASFSGARNYDPVVDVNLTAYAGQNIQVVFWFTSDELIEDGVGWNVDDIRVAEP